jgi:3-hydroxyisobutyrate dehydrogenase-like beta-hydroxyacid dehydrogenase
MGIKAQPIACDSQYQTSVTPAGRMSLASKDMRLALAAADAKTVPMPIVSQIRDHLLEGVAQGEGDSDLSGLARLSARSAGLQTLAP